MRARAALAPDRPHARRVDWSAPTEIVDDATAQAIIRAIVDLGPALGMTSVAEGVETPGQLETLRPLGCDYAQGYEIAEPQSARRVIQRFRRGAASKAPR